MISEQCSGCTAMATRRPQDGQPCQIIPKDQKVIRAPDGLLACSNRPSSSATSARLARRAGASGDVAVHADPEEPCIGRARGELRRACDGGVPESAWRSQDPAPHAQSTFRATSRASRSRSVFRVHGFDIRTAGSTIRALSRSTRDAVDRGATVRTRGHAVSAGRRADGSSVACPAFLLGRDPTHRIICVSFSRGGLRLSSSGCPLRCGEQRL